MRVMVLVKATSESEAGAMPSAALMTEMGRFNDELAKAGILEFAAGLKPSSNGARVRFSGRASVIDGPFAETKELVAGFWIWQVRSMEEAIEWVRRCPNPCRATRSRSGRSSRRRTSPSTSRRRRERSTKTLSDARRRTEHRRRRRARGRLPPRRRRIFATLLRLLGGFDGRGGAARRLHGRRGAVAARRRAGQSGRLAGLGRPLQGDRPPAPRGALRLAGAIAGDAVDDTPMRGPAPDEREASRTTGCG